MIIHFGAHLMIASHGKVLGRFSGSHVTEDIIHPRLPPHPVKVSYFLPRAVHQHQQILSSPFHPPAAGSQFVEYLSEMNIFMKILE